MRSRKLGAAVAAALLLGACGGETAPAGQPAAEEILALQDAIAAAEAQRTAGPAELSVRQRGGEEMEPCESAHCRTLLLELLQSDLLQHPQQLQETGTGGIELNVPGRFWTMTFGADGSLLAAGLTMTG